MKNMFLAVAVAMMCATSSFAGYLNGGASFNSALPSLSGGSNTDQAFTLTLNASSQASGDFANGIIWSSVSVGAYQMSAGTPVSIADANGFGSFSGSVVTDTYSGTNSANGRTVIYYGTFTKTGFDPTAAYVTVQASETGVNYGGSLTLAMDPPPAVPEPASIAIFGLGAVGFAARRFRRK